jgi:TolB-like protein/Tfp pilus assembly protein PilF
MKRCPECRRDYYDETLNFCLDDGASLLAGPSADFQPTAVLPVRGDSPTQVFSAPADSGPSPATIAVLPFVNMSRGEEGDYFSDGLAEELLNVLSKIRGLRVAARTSAFSYKGGNATVEEIGRTLHVASVLEGSVRTAGENVRIAVQLVSTSDGYQLWSESYNRKMEDIFAVQDDIARSVVAELRSRLLDESVDESAARKAESDVALAVKGRSDDPEAHRLLLLGRYFLDRTTREDTAKAVDRFKEALEIDPEYALCWAELAKAYSVQAGRGWAPVEEGFARSREAVVRALELEPDLAEGHAQMGRILASYEWDLHRAEGSYRRARELAPGNTSVLDGMCVLLYKLGRLDEAIELSRQVLARDPLSSAFWHNLGMACHAAGRLAESERAYRRALEIAPQRIGTSAMLAKAKLDQGQTEEAFSAAEAEPEEFWRTWALAVVNFAAGRSADADRDLQKLIDGDVEHNAYQIAEVYAARGETDNAFAWLRRAIEVRDPGVTHLMTGPFFGSLRSDPRWAELISELGF